MTTPTLEPNPTIEAWLDQFGVRWTLKHVTLDQIDRKASAANQARVVAHDPERVRRYTDAIIAGAVFPPLILWQNPKGDRFVVIDGNNRLAAFDNHNIRTWDAYVVHECSSAMRDALTISANSINGDPPTDIERRANAVVLRSKGFTVDQVANMVGLSHNAVSTVARADDARKRLPAGAPFSKLTETSLVNLSRLRSDDVMERAARTTAEWSVPPAKLSALVTELNKARSEVKQLEMLDEFTSELVADRKQPKPTKRPDFSKVQRGAGLILSADPQQVAIQANGEAEELKQRLMELADHALAMADAL